MTAAAQQGKTQSVTAGLEPRKSDGRRSWWSLCFGSFLSWVCAPRTWLRLVLPMRGMPGSLFVRACCATKTGPRPCVIMSHARSCVTFMLQQWPSFACFLHA